MEYGIIVIQPWLISSLRTRSLWAYFLCKCVTQRGQTEHLRLGGDRKTTQTKLLGCSGTQRKSHVRPENCIIHLYERSQGEMGRSLLIPGGEERAHRCFCSPGLPQLSLPELCHLELLDQWAYYSKYKLNECGNDCLPVLLGIIYQDRYSVSFSQQNNLDTNHDSSSCANLSTEVFFTRYTSDKL